MWKEHGVIHFPSTISHPLSVGLSEIYVQVLSGGVCLGGISLCSSGDWGLEIRNAVLSIDIRCIRVHGYTPAEILLGFNPAPTQTSEADLEEWLQRALLVEGDIIGCSEAKVEGHVAQRDERGSLAVQKRGRKQDLISPAKTAGYQEPKPGDLVLLRDFGLVKDKGRKLDPRWSSPRIVDRISKSKVSAHVRQLHDPPGITKRYHFDDLLVFVPRNTEFLNRTLVDVEESRVVYERGAMGDIGEIYQAGQRAFDMSVVESRQQR